MPDSPMMMTDEQRENDHFQSMQDEDVVVLQKTLDDMVAEITAYAVE